MCIRDSPPSLPPSLPACAWTGDEGRGGGVARGGAQEARTHSPRLVSSYAPPTPLLRHARASCYLTRIGHVLACSHAWYAYGGQCAVLRLRMAVPGQYRASTTSVPKL
eukprot:1854536-Rhodomonas_salina.1